MSSAVEVKVASPPAGVSFKLWVHLFTAGSTTQIGEGSVIISDANDVDDLREAIIAKGFSKLEGRKFDELVVKPTPGGAALTPLSTKLSAVKFHLKDDGNLHAYVDVAPKTEGAAAGHAAEGLPPESRHELHTADGIPWTHKDGPLKRGSLVQIAEDELDSRDALFAPSVYVVTQQCLDLIDMFLKNFGDPRWYELGIYGTPGCGKSCAIKIFEAYLRRSIPHARVYSSRQKGSRFKPEVVQRMFQEATNAAPIVLIMDQLDTEDAVRTYSRMARPNFFVILIASANFAYFHEKPITDRPEIFAFPFVFEGGNWSLMLSQLEKKKKLKSPAAEIKFDESKLDSAKSMLPFDFNYATGCFLATPAPAMEQLFLLMNGHPLPMAMYALDANFDSVPKLEKYYLDGVAKFFDSEKGALFYVALVRMFKHLEANPTQSCQVSQPQLADFRFVDERGYILSPFFVQLFKRAVLEQPPPRPVVNPAFLMDANVASEAGHVLERVCLQPQPLFQVSQACIAKIPAYAKFLWDPHVASMRILYRDLKDVVGGVPPIPKFLLTCIPASITQRDIDCLQLYGDGADMLLIGHQVTVQSAQEHKKSLGWRDFVRDLKADPSMHGKNVRCMLVFICKQSTNDILTEEKHVIDDLKALDIAVTDYPAAKAADRNIAAALKLDTELTLEARVLQLEELKHLEQCGCTKSCDTNHCGCFKDKRPCDPAKCKCVPGKCENRGASPSKKAKP